MILTLTPNPSLDLLFSAERLVWEDANRIAMPRRRAGGQGINVVRAVRALDPGSPARALAPFGGPVGRDLRAMLEAEGTPFTAIDIAGETRVFVAVREARTGRALLLNPRGPAVAAQDADRLLELIDRALEDAAPEGRHPPAGGWLACCGSLLPGLDPDFYARAGRLARGRGFRFVPDCDGPALTLAVDAGCDLLVPNAHEAGRLVDRSIDGVAGAARAAVELRGRGPDAVAITLGADGAVAADREGAWHSVVQPPDHLAAGMARGSAVGAGDAFLAAFLLARRRKSLPESLAAAVAAGSAVLLGQGSDLVRAADAARLAPRVRTRRVKT